MVGNNDNICPEFQVADARETTQFPADVLMFVTGCGACMWSACECRQNLCSTTLTSRSQLGRLPTKRTHWPIYFQLCRVTPAGRWCSLRYISIKHNRHVLYGHSPALPNHYWTKYVCVGGERRIVCHYDDLSNNFSDSYPRPWWHMVTLVVCCCCCGVISC